MINRRQLCTAAAALLPATSAFAVDDLDLIRQRKVLRVAVPREFPPFGFMKGNFPEGFDISVARLLAIELKVNPQMVPVQSAERIPYLLEDKVDVIIASLGKNPEREKQIDFSKAYAPLYLGVFGRPGGPADWKARRVGVTKGSVEATELATQLPQAQAVVFDNSKAIIDAYVKGEVDALAAGNVVVESIPDVELRHRTRRLHTLKDSPCYIGVRKNESRLLAEIDRFIDKAGPQALTVNAMVWFKSTFPQDFYTGGKK